jgi:hypothetical protein
MHLFSKSFSGGGGIDIPADAFVSVNGKWQRAVVRRKMWWAVVTKI